MKGCVILLIKNITVNCKVLLPYISEKKKKVFFVLIISDNLRTKIISSVLLAKNFFRKCVGKEYV
jgi:hypothetical protein